jgi:hypothetical protein
MTGAGAGASVHKNIQNQFSFMLRQLHSNFRSDVGAGASHTPNYKS